MKNKHWQFINRYSENDKHWWRFRYSAPEGRGYRPTGIMLSTHGGGYDESDRTFNQLNISFRGRNLGLILPAMLMPFYRVRVNMHSGETYSEVYPREFGFRYSEGAVHFHYGEQLHEWPGDKSKVWFLPWRETRHIRHTLYDDAGDKFADMPEHKLGDNSWQAARALEAACPKRLFLFAEKDGDLRIASCRIEEREWSHGRGVWCWLLAFKQNQVRRYIDIWYSDEVGRRKGSWKGGTLGTACNFVKGELVPVEAFTRHCKTEGLTYIGDVTEYLRTLQCENGKALMDALHAHAMPTEVVDQWTTMIYHAGLTPIFMREKQKLTAWPSYAVDAARTGDVLPRPERPKYGHFQANLRNADEAAIQAMMDDGTTEGQWAGHPVSALKGMKLRTPEEQTAINRGQASNSLHRQHVTQDEMAERIRTVQQEDARRAKGTVAPPPEPYFPEGAGDDVSGD